VIQGSASDLVKSAMIKIQKTLARKYPSGSSCRGAVLVMQLHDELIYEVNQLDINDVKHIVKECMENCMELVVKMKVKMRVGQTWGCLTEV
jgi:DNA polymerase I-like protein with 3'-5' exonuclease and polymerase domains